MVARYTNGFQSTVDIDAAAQCADCLAKVRNSKNPKDILAVLNHAANLEITVAVLKKTNIGKEVNHSMLRHHTNEKVREATAELVGRWKQLALSSKSGAGHPQVEPSTPSTKRRQSNSPWSSRKEPRQHGVEAGLANSNSLTPSSRPGQIKSHEYLEKPTTPVSSGPDACLAGSAAVVQVIQHAEARAQSVRMRVPINKMKFGPDAPVRRKPNGYFCYSYRKTGECGNGTNCKYSHFSSST